MSAPNEKEKALVEKFREEVKDILDEERLKQDHYLLRWIRAREHNLPKAKEMLQNSLKWREERQVDTILQTKKPEYFETRYKYWVQGVCKRGQPLLQVPTGKWNIREIVNQGKSEELMHEFARMMEDVMQNINEAGNLPDEDFPITQFIAICDWSEFGYGLISNWSAISKLLEMVSSFEGHYPESVNAIMFINCPRLFSFVLPLMKACMSGNTVSKLQVYGANKDDWFPELLKIIDQEHIFVHHGGHAKPKDEFCEMNGAEQK